MGHHIQNTSHTLSVGWPPVLGSWHPHVGPGTPAAVLVAVLTVAHGPALAARARWRVLLPLAWVTSTTWIFSLALIDGPRRGIATRLATRNEYLQVIDRFHDIPAALDGFTRHILIHSPDNWPAHVAGHPPAATVTFVLLDRLGLRGGGWAGVWCITVGASACVAVLIAVRALAGEDAARRAAPFVAVAPAAVWMGTSADAYFAAVAAWAVALLAVALTRGSLRAAAASGLLSGLTCYLSYGLTLCAFIAAAVLYLGRHGLRERPVLLVPLLAGATVVPVAFTMAGFDWWEAYHLLTVRYHEGVGGTRPYGYWVWANLACTVLITGLATAAGLRRAGEALANGANGANGPLGRPDGSGDRATANSRSVRRRCAPGVANGRTKPATALALLTSAAVVALLVADLSGMSKAETERIWLPFAMWMLPACAFLPHRRAWLTAQVVLALLLNHLLSTGW